MMNNTKYNWNYPTTIWVGQNRIKDLSLACKKLNISKPLFVTHGLLCIQNLYRYHCILETYKILKYRQPISMYSLFTRSRRKDDLLITPSLSNNFNCQSCRLWNKYRQVCGVSDMITNTTICTFKSGLKRSLLDAQKRYDSEMV